MKKENATVLDILLFVGILFALEFVLSIAVIVIYSGILTLLNPGVSNNDINSLITTSYSFTSCYSLALIILTYFFWEFLKKRYNTKISFSYSPRRFNYILLGAIVLFILSFGYIGDRMADLISGFSGYSKEQSTQMDILMKQKGVDGLLISLFLISLLPAFVEEFFFRGFIQTNLIQRIGPVKGILLTSLSFALLHLDPVWMPAIFALSAMIGYLYYKTENIFYAVFTHAINNLIALISKRSEGCESERIDAFTVFLTQHELVLSLLLLVLSLLVIAKIKVKNDKLEYY